MKYATKISFLLLFSFTLLTGGALIQNFMAESDGENIVLTWNSISEPNVKHYEILRGPDKDMLNFLNTVGAKGSNSTYTFIDESAYKTSNSFYAYGLIVVYNDGTKSDPMRISVTHGVSSVKRTWGSIKALFR
jgi:hypothetical protein